MAFNASPDLANFAGGLNLQDASGVISPADAIDALNVDFLTRGAIQQRYGYAAFTSSAATNRYDSLSPFYTTSGTTQLIAGQSTTVQVLNTAGGSVATQTSLSASPHYFARYGAPGSELVFIGNGTDKIFKWDGSSFTAPASMGTVPKGKYLAVQPSENRLVTCGFSTTTGGPAATTTNKSTVWFSDAGDPTSWGALNYEQLDPGDGEITGMVAWQELLLVFKETHIYVFYGNSEASDGSPIFNYRTIPGPGPIAPQSIVAAPDGVYYVGRSGVYKTTGGTPQLVSGKIGALFGNQPLPGWYTGSAVNQSAVSSCTGTYWNHRLYFGVPTGTSSTNDHVLVFDPDAGNWTVYDWTAGALTTFKPSTSEELMFAYATGSKHVARHSSSYSDDAGSAISARWRGGWFQPFDGETTVREVETWAYGNVTTSAGTDFNDGTGTGVAYDFTSSSTWTWGSGSWTWGSSSWTWGDGPSISRRILRGFGARGFYFSFSFANSTLGRTMRIERIKPRFKGKR
jgi:hypothetical protein